MSHLISKLLFKPLDARHWSIILVVTKNYPPNDLTTVKIFNYIIEFHRFDNKQSDSLDVNTV